MRVEQRGEKDEGRETGGTSQHVRTQLGNGPPGVQSKWRPLNTWSGGPIDTNVQKKHPD